MSRQTLAVAFVLLVACGGDGGRAGPRQEPPTDDAGDADPRVDASDGRAPDSSVDAAPARSSLTVTVERGVPNEVYLPVEDAPIALDAPGGERLEARTDAAGRVVFHGLDWSLGAANVTAYADPPGLLSYVGLPQIDEVTLRLNIPARSHSEATLSGALRNAEPGYLRSVSVLDPHAWVNVTGTDYALQVATGVPLQVVALQDITTRIEGGLERTMFWTVVEREPIDGDTTLDLDLGIHETPERMSGSIGLPPSGALDGTDFNVSMDPVLGWASRAHISSGRLDYEMEILRLLPDDRVSFFAIGFVPGQYGAFTLVRFDGYPRSGRQPVTVLEPAFVEAPARGESLPLHGTIRWRGPATSAFVVRPPLAQGGSTVWTLYLFSDGTELEIPLPPSPAEVADFIGTEPLAGLLGFGDAPEDAPGWVRSGRSRYFELLP